MVNRRRFLSALPATAAGLSGCLDFGDPTTSTGESSPTETPGTESTEPESTPTPSEFDTTYDIRDEGADDTGSEIVDDLLHDLAGDDTLIQFPPGRYRLDNIRILDVSNLALVGDDATLVPNEPGDNVFLALRRVSDAHVEGFSVDNSADNTCGWADVKCTGGTNVVRDYTVEAFGDVDAQTYGFTLMVEGAETSLTLDDVDLSQGAANGKAAYVFAKQYYFGNDTEAGDLTFRNCVMNNWGSEGLYTSDHRGPVHVLGGEYANNARAQVRIGSGNAPEEAVVRDVTIRVDNVPSYMPEDFRTLRGIWLKEGDRATIENCRILIENIDPAYTPGGIVVNSEFGRATIRNCHITTEIPRPGIIIEKPVTELEGMPGMSHLPTEWGVTCQNVTIDGSGSGVESVHVVRRHNCRFQNVHIDRTGDDARGLYLDDVMNFNIKGGSISTDGVPILVDVPMDLDECAVYLDSVSLDGTGLDNAGTELVTDPQATYCVGSRSIPNGPSSGRRTLALTRTNSSNTVSSNGTAQQSHVLYGRWNSTDS